MKKNLLQALCAITTFSFALKAMEIKNTGDVDKAVQEYKTSFYKLSKTNNFNEIKTNYENLKNKIGKFIEDSKSKEVKAVFNELDTEYMNLLNGKKSSLEVFKEIRNKILPKVTGISSIGVTSNQKKKLAAAQALYTLTSGLLETASKGINFPQV